MSEDLERGDMTFLNGRAEFGKIFVARDSNCGDFLSHDRWVRTRDLSFDEGRRHLGLEILEMAEAAQPQAPIVGIPAATLTQILLEEARRPKPEKPNGRRPTRPKSRAGRDDAHAE
jgi:hypothetical protein